MSSTDSQREAAVLQSLRPHLEAEGFEVFLHPSRTMLPPFLHAYHPDAIALKGDKKIAIEVMTRAGHAEAKLERLRELFLGHGDWELRIIYAPHRLPEQDIPVPSRDMIEDQLRRIMTAFEDVGPAASLLLAWAAFEAAARSVLPEDLGRPQEAARVVEVLASGGYITPDEADALRQLGRLRNEAAHGGLGVTLPREDLEKFIAVIRNILGLRDAPVPAVSLQG